MLLAFYGVRSREVARLRLSDIDWQQETIAFTRSKGSARHLFPLRPSVGGAIIRYLKEVRPKSPHRQVFLTRHAPICPLSNGAMWAIVADQLRKWAPFLKHHGPHSIRHYSACGIVGTRRQPTFFAAGVDINTIRAWLGHVSLNTTNIYAEVDLEMKAKALATCEVHGAVPSKHWKKDAALMQFLQSL